MVSKFLIFLGFILLSSVLAQWDYGKTQEQMMSTGMNMMGTGSNIAGGAEASIPGAGNYSKQFGEVECRGLDKFANVPVTQVVVGEGVDFGGDYLCQPTCGGECIPSGNAAEKDAPISGIKYACKCPKERCTAAGAPMIEEMKVNSTAKAAFKVVCAYDGQCGCKGMDTDPKSYRIGYLCNWLNYEKNEKDAHAKPKASPFRWCSCCLT